MSALSVETLSKAAADLHSRILERQTRIRELNESLDRDQRELVLLAELLRLHGQSEAIGAASGARVRGLPVAIGSVKDSQSPLLEAVTMILREAGRPLHIQELTAAVRSQGVSIPGKGSIANV